MDLALLNAWQTKKVKKKQEVFKVLADGVCWRRQALLAALIKIGEQEVLAREKKKSLGEHCQEQMKEDVDSCGECTEKKGKESLSVWVPGLAQRHSSE